MQFSYERRYRGGLRAVLLDWAGTTMDFGCMAPAVVFVQVFENEGVPITMEEARAPMGAHKRVHIQRITEIEGVRRRWIDARGRPPGDEDVDRMFAEFVPRQLACLAQYAALIPGTLETVAALRARGIRIGSTTGYTREMMEINLAEAARQGYVPDATVCATDVPAGRPLPFMCLKNVLDLEVSPIASCVKVDDTIPGVEEGLNAGMWTVGLAMSGNEVGLTLEQLDRLAPDEREMKRRGAYERLAKAGAHYVVDTIADLVPVVDAIADRVARGERP
jgi:phosphonoacetaldehyde hydrolase